MVAPSVYTNRLSFNPVNTIKFLCSYGGKILPRHPDGKLRYFGGQTRVVAVHRSISFSDLLLKMGELTGSSVSLRCQLPKEDLDALVSITCDEDFFHLIEEYDRTASPPSSLKIRAFLSPPKSAKKISPPPSSASSSPTSNSSPIPRVTTPVVERCFRYTSSPVVFPLYVDKPPLKQGRHKLSRRKKQEIMVGLGQPATQLLMQLQDEDGRLSSTEHPVSKHHPFGLTEYRILLSSPRSALQMPRIGMGTAADPFDASALECSVVEAIKLGYRHFDTASSYGSEEPLGEAIAKALKLGLVSSRKELFITSKLWPGDAHYDCVLPALQESLRALRLNYLDLYLIHWPIAYKRGKKKFEAVEEDDLLPMDFKAVWQAMEECQRMGLTSSIGICNFSCKKLQNLLSVAKIPPSVNQVEMNPVWQQKKLRKFCNANGVLLTAYSPLGGKGSFWGTDQVMDCQILKEIAQARNKTVAQVSLRWVYEQGVSILVKSFNRERMKENLRILDWALTEDDYDKINKIQQSRGNGKHILISPRGPYKSLDDLWDGEI